MASKPKKDVPTLALAIRELRRKAGLTQPQLAAELKVRRGAVARWEAGDREPKAGSYSALSEAASKRGLSQLADLFLSQLRTKQAEEETRERDSWALDELETSEFRAREWMDSPDDAKRQAAEEAKRLLDLSRVDRVEFAKQQAKRISDARASMSNGFFAAKVYDITDETSTVDLIRRGRELRAERAYRAWERKVAELPALESVIAENEKVIREKIESILKDAETALGEGKQVDAKAFYGAINRVLGERKRPLKDRQKVYQRFREAIAEYKEALAEGKRYGTLTSYDAVLELGRRLRAKLEQEGLVVKGPEEQDAGTGTNREERTGAAGSKPEGEDGE
jgi:transcriptional regulator with XRE-family HTH domain